jgi:hypothetical protein
MNYNLYGMHPVVLYDSCNENNTAATTGIPSRTHNIQAFELYIDGKQN